MGDGRGVKYGGNTSCGTDRRDKGEKYPKRWRLARRGGCLSLRGVSRFGERERQRSISSCRADIAKPPLDLFIRFVNDRAAFKAGSTILLPLLPCFRRSPHFDPQLLSNRITIFRYSFLGLVRIRVDLRLMLLVIPKIISRWGAILDKVCKLRCRCLIELSTNLQLLRPRLFPSTPCICTGTCWKAHTFVVSLLYKCL